MSSHVLAVIPARFASTRFPGKPLAEIHGKPMIQHVWERVSQLSGLGRMVIATDDGRIQQVAENFGAEVCMTSPAHPSGTDRVWEVARQWPEYAWILNVQGDEPFINPIHLQAALDGMERYPAADIITLVTPITEPDAWRDPNIVKAALSESGQALYFSRAAIPYCRDAGENGSSEVPKGVYRHLGLYLYRRDALERFTRLAPSRLEQLEKLEQLRALENGLSIFAVEVDSAPIGVDTPGDLLRIVDSVSQGFPSV